MMSPHGFTLVSFLLVFIFSILVSTSNASSSSSNEEGLRLIELNETTRRWMTEDQVLALIAKRITFIDVTDHPDLKPATDFLQPLLPTTLKDDPLSKLLSELDEKEIAKTITELSDFYTRYYSTQTGKDAAVYLHNRYSTYIGDAPYATVEFFEHDWLQPSVIARIQGKGPHAEELVILGGHEDSINGGASGRAPGADDDASGSSTVLEVFRVLLENGWGDSVLPDRTIEFHAYAAEEVGLWGSQAIAAKYQEEGKVVAGMLQLDMTGYVKPNTVPVVGVVTDYTNPELTEFVRKLVAAYTNISAVDTRCGYGCSDHASWYKAGYPAAFPFEGRFNDLNPAIHTSSDLLSKLNLEHALQYARIGLSFVVELGLNL